MTASFRDLPVRLIVPSEPSSLRLVRLLVASVAADMNFDYEEIEDLRIAADELVNSLISSAADGDVAVFLGERDGVLHMAAEAPAGNGGAPELDPLAAQIISAIVASHAVEVVNGTLSVSFSSREPSRPPHG